jgi:hypothetical protein
MKKLFYHESTKGRKHERKEKFRAFVINHFWFRLVRVRTVNALRSGFKTSDQVQGQGVPRIESGAYTLVREHFDSRDNAAIGAIGP